MKTYKIKSFIYFLLFAVAAFFYNKIEQEKKFQDEITSSEVVNIDTKQLEDSESEDLDTPLQ
ncbi:hypothetical protein MTsPCn9_20700 [Croceitalea sp. MTPC9]|uniref:hypothetical protein n=1 Tax=unclassified Croceitalea TaxID=2632280 RepID=UPI002B3A3625|nr:hypothetical protein MTsPCn6_25560 [Croceitalea sp. MTPC6]GMN17134.1 hypothetical protein MTsPCn9_20700 [Croceitalea sp. MTPC9]